MEISDIRVRLIRESKERLRAVCSVTFDDAFVVRDVKIVDGTNGTFVAMPSRKLSIHCPKCRHKNQIRARYCNECGSKLPPARPPEDANGRSRFHRDIAHPINTEFRELFQKKVLEAFEQELADNGDAGDSPHQEAKAEDRSDERAPVENAEVRHVAVDDGDAVEQGDAGDKVDDGDAVEESDAVEGVEEKNEYDTLIAGLKPGGGGRSRESGRGARSPSNGDGGRARDQSRGRGRSGSGDRDRDRDRESRGQRPGEPEKRERQPTQKDAPPPVRPVERIAETSSADASDDNEDTQFGAEILIETKTPEKATTTREPEPVQEVVEPQEVVEAIDDDEDGGFGSGLL